jgi:hypothetical protein
MVEDVVSAEYRALTRSFVAFSVRAFSALRR